MSRYDKLEVRGLVAQVANEEEVSRLVNEGKATFYIGFDPTMNSLYAGHSMALCLVKRLQDVDNRPIALVGDDTDIIGDPSGRTDMRSMMTVDQIGKNRESFKRQVSRFIEFGEGKTRMVSNTNQLRNLSYIEFIRDTGPHFLINNTLRMECHRNRMEKRLSFLEFNYTLIQTFDFYELFQCCDCSMQFGDDGQWSNILTGVKLIRCKLGKDARATVTTLLLDSGGKKMGKTVDGAVRLDSNKTSSFALYQYWRNASNRDVLKCLHMLTFLPLLQIDEMDRQEGVKLSEAKGILAYELTTLVHDEEEARKTREGAQALFAGGGTSAHVPTAEFTDEDFSKNKVDILTLLVESGFVVSRSKARCDVQQDGISLGGRSVKDIVVSYDADLFVGEGKLLKRGKKDLVKLAKT